MMPGRLVSIGSRYLRKKIMISAMITASSRYGIAFHSSSKTQITAHAMTMTTKNPRLILVISDRLGFRLARTMRWERDD